MVTQYSIAQLHYITQHTAARSHAQSAELACSGGVRWVQLRVKNTSLEQWRNEALATQRVCKHYGAVLIINDNPALAAAIGADGVHLGKNDMPPQQARAMLSTNAIVGGTANTMDDIVRLVEAGVDYIGLGPFRFTTTKENLSPILCFDGYRKIVAACHTAGIHTPLIAIGGITTADTTALLQTGVHGIAVSSAINAAEAPAEAARQFISDLHAYNL